MDDDVNLDEFLARNNITLDDGSDGDVDLDQFLADENIAPIPGASIGRDVTDEVKQASEVGDFTNQGFYEDLGERPSLDFPTWLAAKASDMVGDDLPTDAQVARRANRINQENYDKQAEDLYNSVGQPITKTRYESPFAVGGDSRVSEVETGRVYERWGTDEEGNVVLEENIRLPEPGSSNLGMVFKEGFNRLYETGATIAGLIPGIDGQKLRDENPNYELTGGQALGADAVALGTSAMAGSALFRAGAGFVRGVDTSTKLGRTALAISSSIGATVGEVLAARDGTSGIVIGPDTVKSWADSTGMDMSDEQAEEWSLAVDGLAVNGTLDTVLGMLGTYVGRPVANKSDGIRKFLDRNYLRKNIEDGKAMEVLGYLDPKGIRDNNPNAALRNISELGRILNDNTKIKLHIAGEEFEVAADTTRAVMNSSEAYIRTSRQSLKSRMSPQEWEEYVQEESAGLSSRMIALMQSQQGTPLVRDSASRVTNEVGAAFGEAAQRRLPTGASSVDEAAQNTAESLAGNARRQADDATRQIDDVERQMAELTRQQAEVVRNSPVIRTFLDEVGGGLSYDDTSFRETLNKVITEDIYPEFKRAADEVDAAYGAIPAGTPIDGKALQEQFDNIVEGIELSDVPGNPAGTIRGILRALGDKFEPKELGEDAAGNPILETADEVADRVSREVDFKDLYQMKGRISQLIDDYSNQPAIQRRLIELRRHITDGDNGQLAFQKQLGGDAGRLAQEADETYKQFRQRFAPNAPMESLSDQMAFTRSREASTPDGERPRGTTDMLVEGNNLLRQAVDEPSGALFDDLVRAASSESAIKEPLADLYIAQAARRLRVALDTGDADKINSVMDAFEANRQRLQTVGAGEILQKLDGAIASIQDDTARMLDDASGLERQKAALEQQVKDAQYGVVGELISDVPGTGPFAARTDAQTRLENLFTRPDSANWVQQIKAKIDELPDASARRAAIQSLEAVALDMIDRRVFGTTPTGMKSARTAFTNVKSSAVERLAADEATNYAKAVGELFGKDSPEAQGILQSLSILSETDLAQKIRVSQSGSDTMPRAVADPGIADAVSTGILLSAGYMNPTAALLRRLSASEVKNASEATKQIAQEALAAIISDPNVFSAMIQNIQRGNLARARDLATTLTAKGTKANLRSLRFNIRTRDEEEREAGTIDSPLEEYMRLLGLQ